MFYEGQRDLACPSTRLNYLVASNIEFSRGHERDHRHEVVVLGPQLSSRDLSDIPILLGTHIKLQRL